MSRELSSERMAYFPNLQRGDCEVTSDETDQYNCIAHAAGKDNMPWWPIEATGVHWPDGVDKKETLECFIQAYASEGYVPCDYNSELEDGFEKIAIYVDPKNEPTHAARQLPDGRWTSKLGDWEDILHKTLDGLEGDMSSCGLGYGKAVQIIKRRRR